MLGTLTGGDTASTTEAATLLIAPTGAFALHVLVLGIPSSFSVFVLHSLVVFGGAALVTFLALSRYTDEPSESAEGTEGG